MSDQSSVGDFSNEDSMFAPEPNTKAKTTKKPAIRKTVAPKKAAPKKVVTKKTSSKKRPVPTPDGESDDGDTSNTPPSKKTKKAPLKNLKVARHLSKNKNNDPISEDDASQELADEGDDVDVELSGNSQKKSSTLTYQKLTQLEHILKRPDTYVGSIEHTEKQMWVYDSPSGMMALKTITYVPGLYKIFDEILVNAADNKTNDPSMDTIKVTFDREKNEVSVYNNGRGIPIEIHDKEGIYIPELIFGHLLTSSNYDDDQKKVTGGRNGYGAKLCNIFSTEFTIETADKKTKQKYKQTWTKNMGTCGKAKITPNPKGDEYTMITFKPDLARFKMTELDEHHESIFKRRVYDLAGTVGKVKVFLNGERISKIKSFKQYCEMYVKAIQEESGDETKLELIHSVVSDRWEIAFAVSNGNFQQVSFVNNIATTSGGTHVDSIATQLSNKLEAIVNKRNKTGAKVKPAQMRNHFFLFVNSQIVNPAFTSQTKEQLTTKPKDFGSHCNVSDDFVKKVQKTDVIANILAFANVKADKALKKSDGSRRSRIHNPQLTDANKAGTKDGHLCTLILTEGLSASGLALGGISAINGRDRYGVFPLRGKVLNVRDASHEQIMKNTEIQNLKQILGLQHKKSYESTKDLRYGHIMIMTDQDHDGSHIKGLLINFFETQFPSLLKIPNFLIEFITPIVKVFKGNLKKPSKELSFFTMPEYEYWKENNSETGWKHKYYKGLGTSDPNEDAKQYFADLDKHMKFFHIMEDEGKKMIELAFSKVKADERKEWLRNYEPGTYLDHTTDKISYTDFVNKELILFSIADCARSIPSVIDGLKPGQRKILFAAFKRNLKNEIKVAQLAGYVSEHTGYQHGEASLQQTITAMGQVYAGANNVNLLEPSGNFGSRLQGGKDAASARYIYTLLSPFTRKVIPPEDDRLLSYNMDDDLKIEPTWYIPILPMILINGAEGIGTGWSSSIPSYNPVDIIANIRRLMEGGDLVPMTPWYRGWSGTVERLSDQKFKFTGVVRQIDELRVEVTELPIKMWTQNFKDKLEEIIKAEKTPSFIRDYVDYNSPTKVHFIITMESEKHLQDALAEGLENKFKLSTLQSTTNLVAFDEFGRIMKYNTVEDIMKEFYSVRLRYYQLRKERLLQDLNSELQKLTEQARFIRMIISKELIVSGRKRVDVISQLQKHKFITFTKKKEAEIAGELEPIVENDENNEGADQALLDTNKVGDGYNYLLGMAIWTLTEEKAQKLMSDVSSKEAEIDVLVKKSPKDLWNNELDQFLEQWHHQLDEDVRMAQTMPKKKSNKLAKGKSKKAAYGDESDFESPVPKKRRAPAKKQTALPFAAEPPLERKPAASRAATKKKILVIDEDDSSSQDTGFDLPTKSRSLKPKVSPSHEDIEMTGVKAKVSRKQSPLQSGGESFLTAEEPMPQKNQDLHLNDTQNSDSDKPKKTILKTKPKPATKLKSKGVAKVDVEEPSIYDIDGYEPIAKPLAAKKRAAAQKQLIKPKGSDSDDDSLGDMSAMVKGIGEESSLSVRPLFAESRKSAIVSTKLKKTGTSKLSDSAIATQISSYADTMDLDESEQAFPQKKIAAAQKTAPQKPPRKEPIKKSTTKVGTKAASKSKPKSIVSSDEDEVDEMVDKLLDSDDDDIAPIRTAKGKTLMKTTSKSNSNSVAGSMKATQSTAVAARPARHRTTAPKKTYTIDIDSDEEDDGDEESEEYDDLED